MAYLQSTGGEPIPPEQIEAMGRALDLVIPPEDLEALSTALRDQLASVERIESLDLTGIAPARQFDPRWHD
jgi:hypothetical protein